MFAVWRTLGHIGLEICENTIYFSLEICELKLFQNIESFYEAKGARRFYTVRGEEQFEF